MGTQHLNPYIEHGMKQDKIKKMTVSVPIDVYNTIQRERQRRIENKMRHATASELLCEAFAHAYTGRPLPEDEELLRYISKARAEKFEFERKKNRDEKINNAVILAESYVGFPEFREHLYKIVDSRLTSQEKTIHLYRLINLLSTFIIYDAMSAYQLRTESQHLYETIEKVNKYTNFLKFIEYNVNSSNRNALMANEIKKILEKKNLDHDRV